MKNHLTGLLACVKCKIVSAITRFKHDLVGFDISLYVLLLQLSAKQEVNKCYFKKFFV